MSVSRVNQPRDLGCLTRTRKGPPVRDPPLGGSSTGSWEGCWRPVMVVDAQQINLDIRYDAIRKPTLLLFKNQPGTNSSLSWPTTIPRNNYRHMLCRWRHTVSILYIYICTIYTPIYISARTNRHIWPKSFSFCFLVQGFIFPACGTCLRDERITYYKKKKKIIYILYIQYLLFTKQIRYIMPFTFYYYYVSKRWQDQKTKMNLTNNALDRETIMT